MTSTGQTSVMKSLLGWLAAIYLAGCGLLSIAVWWYLERIPNNTKYPLPANERQNKLEKKLSEHVEMLATHIGERSYQRLCNLNKARQYVEQQFSNLQDSTRRKNPLLTYKVPEFIKKSANDAVQLTDYSKTQLPCAASIEKTEFANIELEIEGSTHKNEVVIVGAHYDSDSYEARRAKQASNPGADDNATGVAALIELASHFQGRRPRTIRFVAFTNEEEPFFQTKWMGSYQYATSTRHRGQVKAMISLETMGYYSDKSISQSFVHGTVDGALYLLNGLPHVGNFIAFVSAPYAVDLMRTAIASFRNRVTFPSEGIALPPVLRAIEFSDHWSYRQIGVKAIMITDTAPKRNACYHRVCDRTTDDDGTARLDYDRFGRVVVGLQGVVETLADPSKWR